MASTLRRRDDKSVRPISGHWATCLRTSGSTAEYAEETLRPIRTAARPAARPPAWKPRRQREKKSIDAVVSASSVPTIRSRAPLAPVWMWDGRFDRLLNAVADQSLDAGQKTVLAAIAEGNGTAVLAHSPRSTDSMHVRFGDVRQLVVDDVRNAVDVDTA